jgi:hypothetical protein
MNDTKVVQQILSHDSQAQCRFIERYSNLILHGLIRKCRQNCFRRGCPVRFSLSQRNLEQARCDELSELYVFSLESLLTALKSYRGVESLDDWVHHQTNPYGLPFRQRFAAYMAKKYPITGRARIPDRFLHRWSSVQKRVYQEWLRQRTIPEIAVKVKLSEAETMAVLEELLAQLDEAGLLGTLEAGVRLEAFQQRERWTYEGAHEGTQSRRQMEPSIADEQFDSTDPLTNVPQAQVEVSDKLLIEALRGSLEHAISDLSPQQRRLLALKFDSEWTLREIAQQSEGLGLGNLTDKQVGHAIDNILRQMLTTINRALAAVEDVNLQLPQLKRVLLEWGTQEIGQ